MAVIIDQGGNPEVDQVRKVDLRELLKSQSLTLDDIPDSAYRFAVPQVDFNGFPVVDLSSPQYGALTVSNLIATNLSAISAQTGTLVISKGGNIHSGETAYQTGIGFWLGTDANGNPQFSIVDSNGNYIKFDGSSATPIQISSTGLINALSSKQVDDGGWKTLAQYNFIGGLPTTRAGYGITDAQATLPNATAVGQVLQRDNGGAPYFNQKYGPEMNYGEVGLGSQGFTSSSYVQYGGTLGIPKPGVPVSIFVHARLQMTASAGTINAGFKLQWSLNGGSTWVDQDDPSYTAATTTGGSIILTGASGIGGVSASGDIQFRLLVANLNALGTLNMSPEGYIAAFIFPNSNFYIIGAALSATIPSTGAGNCSAAMPATTCTASENVTVNPSGGTPPYTYSWSVVSGTGTITAGATSQTCTVSDTETTADSPGATSNTTIKCTVTDSVPNNATSGNDVITNTFIRTYNAISGSVANNDGSCTKQICPQSCSAQGTLTANATGGNGIYTYSWSITSGGGTILSGSTSQTATIGQTGSTSPGGTIRSTTGKCAVNDTRGTGSVNMSGTVNLTFTCNS